MLIGYVICKFFLPFGGLSLHFLDGVLWSIILKILTISCLSVLFFWCLWFWCHFYFFIFSFAFRHIFPFLILCLTHPLGTLCQDHSSSLRALSSLRQSWALPVLLATPCTLAELTCPLAHLFPDRLGLLEGRTVFSFCWVSRPGTE